MPTTQLLALAFCAVVALLGVTLLRASTGELTHRVLGWSALAAIYMATFPNA